VSRMRTVLAVALATLALVAVAPTAQAGEPGDPSLSLVSPRPYQVFQRDAGGRGDILVAGRAVGLGSDLEARWGDEAWVPFAART